MPQYIAFLRAINVGGHNVKMEELRALFEGMGFSEVATFIASGNVMFLSKEKETTKQESKIETALQEALGYTVETFIRTPSELAAIVEHKPFSDELLTEAKALNVAFLKAPLTFEQQTQLQGFRTEIDEFHTQGREAYWLCRSKQSESTFSNSVFERTLKLKATFRGINTVRKLAAKYVV